MNNIQKISLIGSGNVATHIGKNLFDQGIKIDCVFSRNIENATVLAEKINSKALNKLSSIVSDSDLYIFSVSDGVIHSLAEQLSGIVGSARNVVHTSGMISKDVFKGLFSQYGVLYPLQTFTKNRLIDIIKVPFCITANNQRFEKKLVDLANMISSNVLLVDDIDRNKLHVAAVFVNNFTNFMYSIGKDITEKNNLDFELLLPLIEETSAKVMEGFNPENIQTGPAKRGDHITIEKHLKYLEKFPNYKEVYRFLTKKLMK